MNGMGRQWKAAVNLLLILIVCLCGCGAKAKTEATPKGTDAYEAYEVEEIMFPAADAEIEKLLTEDQTYTAGEYLLHGGKVYRQAQVYSGEGDRKASYLQSLSAPYKSWDITVIGSCQIEGKTYVADKLFFVKDVPAYCLLTSADGDGEKQYFAKYADGAVGEVVCAVPDSLDIGYGTELVFDADGEIYTYVRTGSKLVWRDEELLSKSEWELSGRIWGMPENAVGKEKCWFGATDEGIGFYTMNGKKVVKGPENVIANYFYMDVSKKGVVYLADNNAV